MLCVVSSLEPDIILEIGTGTSYPFTNCPVVGSKTDDLVQYLLESYSVLIISVCKVIPHFGASFFNKVAHILKQYLNHYPELCINIISWRHMSFSNPKVRVCLYDGIHLELPWPVFPLSHCHLECPSLSLIFLHKVLRLHNLCLYKEFQPLCLQFIYLWAPYSCGLI